MRNPTDRSFNQLLNATTADEIIPAIAQCCWEVRGNEGKPPHLTTSKLWYALPSELDYFANIQCALDREWERWQSMAYSHLFECFRAIGLDVQAIPIEQWNIMGNMERNQAVYFVWENNALLFSETPDWIKEILSIDNFTRAADITAEAKRAFTDKYTEPQRQCAHFDQLYIDLSSLIHYVTQHFTRRIPEHIPEHMRPTTDEERKEVYLLMMNEKLKRIHSFWKFCYEKNDSLSHPFTPFIRAWLTEQTAKHINKEYDRTHTVAVLRSGIAWQHSGCRSGYGWCWTIACYYSQFRADTSESTHAVGGRKRFNSARLSSVSHTMEWQIQKNNKKRCSFTWREDRGRGILSIRERRDKSRTQVRFRDAAPSIPPRLERSTNFR